MITDPPTTTASPLPPREQSANDDADDNGGDCHGADSVLGDLLQAEDHAEHRHEGHAGADQVQAPGLRVLVFGQDHRPEDEQQPHDGQCKQEHGAPPEVLEEDPAEDRSNRATCRERRDPDADGDGPLARVLEHAEDQ
jgi:hypothetical protein